MDFVLANPTIVTEPTLPTPTVSSIASIGPTGTVIRQQKSHPPHRYPGTAPYPTVQRSRSLMERIGITPTIETSKKFEEIARIEERKQANPSRYETILAEEGPRFVRKKDDPFIHKQPILTPVALEDLAEKLDCNPLVAENKRDAILKANREFGIPMLGRYTLEEFGRSITPDPAPPASQTETGLVHSSDLS